MQAIMTGKSVGLAYWNGKGAVGSTPTLVAPPEQKAQQMRGFASLSAFADNLNHAPAGSDGAVTWDAGLDLLFRIAGRG